MLARPAPPQNAEWLATMRCNLQCEHCCASAGAPRDGELGTDEAIRVLGELAELGVRHLCISGGELTLRPDWEPLVALALSKFRGVAIITNGRLGAGLFDGLERMDHRRGLTVMVSLDGTREVHDARRGRGSFDKALEALGARTEIRRDVITTVGVDNLHDLDGVGRIVHELGVSEWTVQPAIPIGRMPHASFVGKKGLEAIASFVVYARERYRGTRVSTPCSFGYFHAMRDGAPWSGCPAAHDSLAIMADGDVYPCVAVPDWACGNVRSQSLREIWDGPAMDAIRYGRPTSCGDCSRCPSGCELMERALGRQFCTLE